MASALLGNKCAWWRNDIELVRLKICVASLTFCFWEPTRLRCFSVSLKRVLYTPSAFASNNFWKSSLLSVALCLSESAGRKKPLLNKWFRANFIRWGTSVSKKKTWSVIICSYFTSFKNRNEKYQCLLVKYMLQNIILVWWKLNPRVWVDNKHYVNIFTDPFYTYIW